MIKILTERIVKRGLPMYKVILIKALSDKELPGEYLEERPHCFKDKVLNRDCLIINTNQMLFDSIYTISAYKNHENSTIITPFDEPIDSLWIFEGFAYHKKIFERTMEIVAKCGTRLKAINDRIRRKKLLESWVGKRKWAI
jgi:hypothetical protein